MTSSSRLLLLAVVMPLAASCVQVAPSRQAGGACGEDVGHPDDIPCGGGSVAADSIAADVSGEDGVYFYLFWPLRFLNPGLDSTCRIERFFRNQDLTFANDLSFEAADVSVVRISAVGDLMAREELNDANSTHLYDDIADELFGADIVFGNLESPVHPEVATRAHIPFNLSGETVRRYLATDRAHGFDIVSTGNNHAFDQQEAGLLATLDELDALGVLHVGTSRSVEERDQAFPIIEKQGIRIAFLGYTYSINGHELPAGREYEVNLLPLNTLQGVPDIALIESHIASARQFGADVVVVSLHWSIEHTFYPAARFIDLAHRIADAGADVILGHHPHILNPLESYVPAVRDAGVPEVLIAYSLGNFIPSPVHQNTLYRTTIVLNVELSRGLHDGGRKVWISKVDYTPVWWYENTTAGGDYRLINLDTALATPTDYPFLDDENLDMLRTSETFIMDRFQSCHMQ